MCRCGFVGTLSAPAVAGIEHDVVFNDDICIYYNGEVANKADIDAIFESLK